MVPNRTKVISPPTILNRKDKEQRGGGIIEQVLNINFLPGALPGIKNQSTDKRSTLVGKGRRVSVSSTKDNSSSDDGCSKLSDALPYFIKLNTNSESETVSHSSTFDEFDQAYSRRSHSSVDLQDYPLNKSDFLQDKKEGFGRRLSFSPSLCATSTNDSRDDVTDQAVCDASADLLLLCRNSAQNSPLRMRYRPGSPKQSRRVSISETKSIDDVSNLNQQLLDALQRGGFTESYRKEVPAISPSFTPLRTPSPNRSAPLSKYNNLRVILPHDPNTLLTPDHLLRMNGLNSLKVSTSAKSPTIPKTVARRPHSIYLTPGIKGVSTKVEKITDTLVDATKIDCNHGKEEMIIRADERQRRRSEILSRRMIRRDSTAVAALSACLYVQKKFDEIAVKDNKTGKSESRRQFWFKVISMLSAAEHMVENLPTRLMNYRKFKHMEKSSQIILRIFLKHREMRFHLIKQKLSSSFMKKGKLGKLRVHADILRPLVS